MQAPKSMTGIFHDLATNRQEAHAAQAKFVVVSLKKNGTPCKVLAQDLAGMNATLTMPQAEARKQAMECLNPTMSFTIITL